MENITEVEAETINNIITEIFELILIDNS